MRFYRDARVVVESLQFKVRLCGLACGVALGIMWANNYTQPPAFAPRRNDEFNIAAVTFIGGSGVAGNQINMTIQNTGSSSWTLKNTAQVNSVAGLAVTPIGNNGAYNCSNGQSIKIQSRWNSARAMPSMILVGIRIRAETRSSEQPLYNMIVGLIKPVSKN